MAVGCGTLKSPGPLHNKTILKDMYVLYILSYFVCMYVCMYVIDICSTYIFHLTPKYECMRV